MATGPRSFTQRLLRWPILIVVYSIITFEFILYLCVRLMVSAFEWTATFRFRKERRALAAATDFVQFVQAARELDRLEQRDPWKLEDESPYYDHQLIKSHMQTLRTARQNRQWDALLQMLKVVFTTYNVGGINNSQLYSQTHFGTKLLVHDFIQEVLEASIVVRDAEDIPLQTRREFFKRARKWYGRTALLLSGGAALGYYHVGVLKTLIEAKCLPQVISGSSAGSLMCSFIACRTDQEVLRDLCSPEGERWFRACEEALCVKLTRWLRYGYLFDAKHWIGLMRNGITRGDTTFLEAYKMSGRIINITVTGTSHYSPSVVLNFRTTPDVVIWSAVLASSSFPNVLAPQLLQIKNPVTKQLEPFTVHGRSFRDGTIKHDVPMKEMSRMWNANFFIVSQVNPHLMPFFFAQRGGTGRPATSLTGGKGASGHRGGFLLAMFERLLKLEMKKWSKFLADLDLLPTVFGVDWRFIWLQKLSGTVTIVPDAPLWAYFRLVSDPNPARWKHYILEGERATWYKLGRISNHFRLEKMLLECSRHLDNLAMKQGLLAKQARGHRLPPSMPGAGSSAQQSNPQAQIQRQRQYVVSGGESADVPPSASPPTVAHAASASTTSSDADTSSLPLRRGSSSDSSKKAKRAANGGSHRHAGVSASRGRTNSSEGSSSDSPALRPVAPTGSDEEAAADIDEEDREVAAAVISGSGEINDSLTASILEQLPLQQWKRGMESDVSDVGDDTDNEREESQNSRRGSRRNLADANS